MGIARRQSKRRTILNVLLLVVGLLAFGFLCLLGYVLYRTYQFERMVDTRDLQERVERAANGYLAQRPHGGLVIGVIQREQSFVAGFGRGPLADGSPPDGDTLYEIGSVTKLFTAITLSQLAKDGLVGLDDPVVRYLPADVMVAPQVGAITLRQLAQHSSGLPRLPHNLDATAADPYARYTARDLHDYLAQARLDYPPGRRTVYSNLGFGLLGHLLVLATNTPYEPLVQQRLLAPLGMRDTAITLTAEQQARFIQGFSVDGAPVPYWEFDVLAPAGAFRSTPHDLMTFLAACMQQAGANQEASKAPLGWQLETTLEGQEVVWHNGGTGGFVSFIGFDQRHEVGVVLLSNTGDALVGEPALDLLGFALLREAAKISLAS